MNRIAPETVREAFVEYGGGDLIPEQDVYSRPSEDGTKDHCCGLVAVYLMTAGGEAVGNLEIDSVVLSTELQLHPHYSLGFMSGWDGAEDPPLPSELCRIGYEDGRAAWILVTQEGA